MKAFLICILSICLPVVAYGQSVTAGKNDEALEVQQSKRDRNSFALAFNKGGFDNVQLNQLSNGTLTEFNFYSTYLREDRTMYVYVPACTDTAGCEDKRYPVIYFLHSSGFGQYGLTDLRVLAGFGSIILDNLIAQNSIRPMIVVFPDGSEPHFGGSFYTDSELYGPFEGHIVNEVVDIVQRNFPARQNRMRRGVMGPSMGGYGAMKIALNPTHNYKYRAVASHSAPLDIASTCYQ